MIKPPAGMLAALAARIASASRREPTPSKRACSVPGVGTAREVEVVAISPGMTVAPATSMTRVPAPRIARHFRARAARDDTTAVNRERLDHAEGPRRRSGFYRA